MHGIRQPVYQNPALAAPPIPAGTFAPGTKVQVGSHRVVIERYLSEGGFAHVYLVRLPKPISGDDGAVLKRVAVPDKETLASMRTEVETMQKLRGRRHIVTYIDSHASQMKSGGFEVFLLMEYCNGGGLIDFMNTRLQNRLTESEVLNIFSDVALGVADMHYLKHPLLHRDLKVENVLITSSGSSKCYKLCDFGSTAPPRPAATNATEGQLIEEDVQKHTTLQYRSPEMIDVYRKQSIDEKSDIWALGVLLYKLCYYKTPFEEQGQMAILNASFKFPGYPLFSDNLKKLIASMLREQPQARPNIYQVVREVSLLRGSNIPIKDIYAGRTQSEARRNQYLPPAASDLASPPIAGAHRAPVEEKKLVIPDVTPMRRGRPTKADNGKHPHRPSPSPAKSFDPFHALDSKQSQALEALPDNIASRFPPLEQFSLLHDSGGAFEFQSQPEKSPAPTEDLNRRVTNALADEAFAQAPDTSRQSIQPTLKPDTNKDNVVFNEEIGKLRRSKPDTGPVQRKQSPERPSMVSTGTMTSPTSPPSTRAAVVTSSSQPPVFKFPARQDSRLTAQPKPTELSNALSSNSRPSRDLLERPAMLEQRSKSQVWPLSVPKAPSSRLSLETQRPSHLELHESMHRSRSTNSKARPLSESLGSKMGFLRNRKSSNERVTSAETSRLTSGPQDSQSSGGGDVSVVEETGKINSEVDFLRAMEEEDPSKRKDKRHSSGPKHVKRSSMPSISLSGTKSLISGRFGEAFRRFESTPSDSSAGLPPLSLSPSQTLHDLTPIAGSEATDSKSDDGRVIDESEDVPPEMRRELERRRLSQEERRVAEAAAAYKQRMNQTSNSIRGSDEAENVNEKAASIQTRVRSLLDESNRSSPVKTAPILQQVSRSPAPTFAFPRPGSIPAQPAQPPSKAPPVGRKPLPVNTLPPSLVTQPSLPASSSSSSDPSVAPRLNVPPKPGNKPQVLRQGEARPPSPAKPSHLASKALPSLPPQNQRTPYPPSQSFFASSVQRNLSSQSPPESDQLNDGTFNEDWKSSFSKKYPDLSGLGMIETEIDRAKAPPSGGRDTRKIGEV